MTDLGWMNGWKQDGPEYKAIKACQQSDHKTKSNHQWECCITTVVCHECSYTYKIDSSG